MPVADLVLAFAAVASLGAVVTLVALARGWIVARPEVRRAEAATDAEFRRMESDRDSWRNMSLKHLSENRGLLETNRQLQAELVELAKALREPHEQHPPTARPGDGAD